MKCFVAELKGGRHINVPADRMERWESAILAFDGGELIAVVNVEEIRSAHISEKQEKQPACQEKEDDAPPKPDTSIAIPHEKQSLEPVETGYKGFLYIKCEACGSTKGFCVKAPIKVSRCDCGHSTALGNLKPLYVNCKCGENFKYMTNLTERTASMDCIKCGAPVDLEYHGKKGVYATIE